MKLPRKRWIALGLLVASAAAVSPLAWRHARAASLLLRFSSDRPGRLGSVGAYEIAEAPAQFEVGGATVAARIYRPRGVDHPPGLVLVHGVHHLGIDEPRLQRFARTLASAGVEVFTPQVQELADYRVDPHSLVTIGAAAGAFSRQLGARRVGLMGLSFAGGLSLVVASDPRFAAHVGFVVAVGAHDDLERVSRFFALDQIVLPDGTTQPFKAHEYGLLVLARSHVADFFAPPDQAAASEALKRWLWDDRDGAKKEAQELTPGGQKQLALFFDHQLQTLRPELLKCIAHDEAAMAAVSPSAHLKTLAVPALLLHGASDNVIPASETLWLASHVPKPELQEALVSPALQHVELEGQPSLGDEWALVHFMAMVLGDAEG